MGLVFHSNNNWSNWVKLRKQLQCTNLAEEAGERLLVGAGGQTGIGSDQIVDTPEISLQQFPPILNKMLLLSQRRVKLIKLAVSFEHIPLCVSDPDVNLQEL